MKDNGPFVLALRDIDKTMVSLFGGKAANLGELTQIESVSVPDGFCISTEAFRYIVGASPLVQKLLDELALLDKDNLEEIRTLSSNVRDLIAGTAIPAFIVEEIIHHVNALGNQKAYAIRSSATAEDLPAASFAGQQDTYLNVIGTGAILTHVSKCWASLFTERAVIYRIQNGFDHRKVELSVVVQQMILPDASGIMFTADPITGNRKILSIDAAFGLGEALVSGLVTADNYCVRNEKHAKNPVLNKRISLKTVATRAVTTGGTIEQALSPERQNLQVLTDEQILRLAAFGRKIEAYFGQPQDIEWCRKGDSFHFVQSRPITTLFPVPITNDQQFHLYLSVGHQQMMTDPIRPLGLSFFLMTTKGTMQVAGGRLFVDIADKLADPVSREAIIGNSDPLTRDALLAWLEREGFQTLTPETKDLLATGKNSQVISSSGFRNKIENNPALITELIKKTEAALATLKADISAQYGTALFDFIRKDVVESRSVLFNPQSLAVILAAMDASNWINEKIKEWLGVTNAVDVLTQSVSNNITSEMGLALMDVADAVRPYPELIRYLQTAADDNFLNELNGFEGGKIVAKVVRDFLIKYGVRCTGEIDITSTRWSEKPSILIPMILNNIKNFESGESHRRFERGLQQALDQRRSILQQLTQLPDGQQKADEARQMIDLVRNFIGYREYPKYSLVCRYAVYKQALMKEAERLERDGVVHSRDDVYHLTFDELAEAVRTNTLNGQIVVARKNEYHLFEKLTPPRVITSDGEVITGKYRRDGLPANALPGLAVSSGIVEGRARVIRNMKDAVMEPGDILVTAFTDPSWTPLFVSIKGLVTEVGGLMTHGAVVAREYGLPAVVGVENATRIIKDGDLIRVHGSDGFVQIL